MTILAAFLQHAINLAYLLGLCLLAVGLGGILLHKGGIRFNSPLEGILFSAAIGFGILSYSVFVLGTFQLLYPVTVRILLGIYALLCVSGWFAMRGVSIQAFFMEKPDFGDKIGFKTPAGNKRVIFEWNRCFFAILLICLLSGFFLVLTPAIGRDALIYHLAVPKLYLNNHGFYFIEGNIFSQYPLNSEMVFLIGLALKGDILAKGIHFSMAILVLASMWQFNKQYLAGASFIPLALLIFYTVPSVFLNSHMAYNDLTLTFYTFLAVYAFLNWFSRKETRWIILCAVLSGLAMATKYSGLLLPFLGFLGISWGCWHQRTSFNHLWRLLLIYLLFSIVVGSPFYVKNWIMTGNPFYPFLYALFGGKGWSIDQARYYDFFLQMLGMGRSFWDYLMIPWNLSFHAKIDSSQFDGILGPVFILMLPFAIGLRNIAIEMKIVMVYCLFMFMFWASSAQQIRYLIPIIPFLAITIVYILNYYQKRIGVMVILTMFIALGLGFNGYHLVNDLRKIKPLRVVTGHEDRDEFLNRMIPAYGMFQYVNNSLPEDSKVFLIYMKNLGYLIERPYYSDSMFESYTIEKILGESAVPEEIYRALNEMGITHILYNINYITGKFSTFSSWERELFLAFQSDYLELVKSEKQSFYLYRLVK